MIENIIAFLKIATFEAGSSIYSSQKSGPAPYIAHADQRNQSHYPTIKSLLYDLHLSSTVYFMRSASPEHFPLMREVFWLAPTLDFCHGDNQ
mmetsp:Transcript_24891/g.32989  ORF Transcript_24891/g.32989 Transcript_24891/m.32989 type:complete len:92 (-) Transcript_24891:83-358(-)